MSHGDRVETLAAGLHRDRVVVELAARGDGRRRAQDLRAAVPSRGHAHRAGDGRSSAASCSTSAAASRSGRAKNIIAEHIEKIRAKVGKRSRAARAFGRRRFVGRRGAAARGDRRSARLRVRRHRPAALERRRSGDERVREAPRRERDSRRRRRRRSSRGSAGVADPEQKRKIIGRLFVEVFERRSREDSRTCSGSRRARSIPT